MRPASDWVNPGTPGLSQARCVACGDLCVERTMTRLHCRECTVRLGVLPEPVPLGEQLQLGP